MGIRIEPLGPYAQVTIKDCRITETSEAAIDIADGVTYEIEGNRFVAGATLTRREHPWWRRLLRRLTARRK